MNLSFEEPIRLLASGINVYPLLAELETNPQLWDANTFRRTEGSPHLQLSDIIVRYNDWANWTGDRIAFNEYHESVWWSALDCIPSVKKIVFDVMRMVNGERLGMVLITKIPPGAECLPHKDAGWHANYYDKYAVQIKANDKQAFCFEKLQLISKAGDLFAFDNSYTHWVTNESDDERITLIISIRTADTRKAG